MADDEVAMTQGAELADLWEMALEATETGQ